jgi:urate oxidase
MELHQKHCQALQNFPYMSQISFHKDNKTNWVTEINAEDWEVTFSFNFISKRTVPSAFTLINFWNIEVRIL